MRQTHEVVQDSTGLHLVAVHIVVRIDGLLLRIAGAACQDNVEVVVGSTHGLREDVVLRGIAVRDLAQTVLADAFVDRVDGLQRDSATAAAVIAPMVRADHDGRYRPLPVATTDRIRRRPQAGLVRKEFDRQVIPVRRRTLLSPGDGITARVDTLNTTIDEVSDRSLC